MNIDMFSWISAAILVVCFVGAQIFDRLAHREWIREGDALSREFDCMWSERARTLDRQVARWDSATDEERERIREAVLDWFRRMDDHGMRRAQWAARAK